MPYVARNPDAFLGHSVGNGECVALVEQAAHTPRTAHWHRGAQVKGNMNITVGTVIATFDAHGNYGNHKGHTSHAAIYLGQDANGIHIIDQWNDHANGKTYPQAAHERYLNYSAIHKYYVDNGDNYFVFQ